MLNSYGWSDTLQQQFQPHAARGLSPARVTVQQRGLYVLATSMGEATAQLSGRFAHEAEAGTYPVAGDWVAAAVRPAEASATIHDVLPRRSAFLRKAVGGGHAAQVVAANADVAFLVASLNADLNARRIERYLATAWDSGASPVVVLTKADLCPDAGSAQGRDRGRRHRRARLRGVGRYRRGSGCAGRVLRARPDGRAARQLRRRQVEPRECACGRSR